MSAQKYAPTATSVPEVQRDVEGLVEAVVLLQIRPVGGPGNEDQVPGGRDRQELGEPLDEAEHERLGIRERGRIVPHAGEREHERETERRPRDAVHERAAHRLILRGGNDVSPRAPTFAAVHRTAESGSPANCA